MMRVLCYFIFALFIDWSYADCGVITKKEWNGLPAQRVEYLPRPVNLVIIEHTGGQGCTTPDKCKEQLRSTQVQMMIVNNYTDIAYSFMVGGDGKIYEGVGWVRAGAHTYAYNHKSIGIAFMGNYNNDTPKNEQLESVKELLKCGVEEGHLTPDYHIIGQNQVLNNTESPGRNVYNVIKKWPHYLEKVDQIKN